MLNLSEKLNFGKIVEELHFCTCCFFGGLWDPPGLEMAQNGNKAMTSKLSEVVGMTTSA